MNRSVGGAFPFGDLGNTVTRAALLAAERSVFRLCNGVDLATISGKFRKREDNANRL